MRWRRTSWARVAFVVTPLAAILLAVGLLLPGSPPRAFDVATLAPSPPERKLVEPVDDSTTQGARPAPSPTGQRTASASATPDSTHAPSPSPSPSAKPAETPGNTQVRAVWAHLFDDTLKTRAGIRDMVAATAAANANLLIVEVVRRQDAYYASDVLPRTNDPALEAGLDVLDEVLEQAHARGIAVQAWVPLLPTYHHAYDEFPSPDGWIWTEHGPNAPEADRWVTRRRDGTWSDYLDPALPEVADHAAAVLAELAARDIDGVHLDYTRYAGSEYGYHPRALQRFRDETGRTGTPEPDDQQWSDWRRDQVTNLVTDVRAAVTKVAPDVPVTAAVVAQGEGPRALGGFVHTRGYTSFFQDWERWVDDGLLDMAVPMIYFNEQTHGEWFDDWTRWAGALADRSSAIIVGGQGSWLNEVDDSLHQLAAQQARLDGVSVYSYQQNQSSEPFDRLLAELPAGLWHGRASLPSGFAPHVPPS